MYLLKTKGTAKIPDYIQIRDDDFILIDHFRADNNEKISAFATRLCRDKLENCSFVKQKEEFNKLVNKLPYGILKKIDMLS